MSTAYYALQDPPLSQLRMRLVEDAGEIAAAGASRRYVELSAPDGQLLARLSESVAMALGHWLDRKVPAPPRFKAINSFL